MMDTFYKSISAAQVGNFVRVVGGIAITNGLQYMTVNHWISQGDALTLTAALVGALVTLSMAAWGANANSAASKISDVKEMPGMSVVHTVNGPEQAAVLQKISEVQGVIGIVTTQGNANAAPSTSIVGTVAELKSPRG